ncbi:MAG: energy-coupling factor ABC transporter permease [Dehalococcoidia bacterium]
MFSITGPIGGLEVSLPPPLHAPDGFFSIPVAVAAWLISAAVIFVAIRMTGRQLNERLVPAMGVFAAFIFAAQMFNFPIAGGTSGHLVGGALAAIVLGPWAAVLVVTSVVVIQALMFQDGGLVVMGVNILNMAVLSSFGGYLLYVAARRLIPNEWGILIPGAVAAWASVEIAAIAAAVQLSLSGTSPLSIALPAMAGVHVLIGIGEALITVGALAVILASRKDLLQLSSASSTGAAR